MLLPRSRPRHDDAPNARAAAAVLPCRQRVLPLVCKRWEQVAHFPSLLDSVKVCIETEYMCDGELLLPPLRCFCRWLERRAAGSVQRLDISLDSREPQLNCEYVGEIVGEMFCRAELAAPLAACGSPGQLAELRLHLCALSCASLDDLVSTLTSLQHLNIEACRLDGRASLTALTRLTHMSAFGEPVIFAPSLKLPASLKYLFLKYSREEDLSLLHPVSC